MFHSESAALLTYTPGVAGYTHLYVVGGEGGFAGADGVNPIKTLILVGGADRVWFEGRYLDPNHGPMGKLKTIVPAEPEPLDALLDACLAFHPAPFRDCPSFTSVVEQLGDTEHLEFSVWTAIPRAWPRLREEGRSILPTLHIWSAKLEALQVED